MEASAAGARAAEERAVAARAVAARAVAAAAVAEAAVAEAAEAEAGVEAEEEASRGGGGEKGFNPILSHSNLSLRSFLS